MVPWVAGRLDELLDSQVGGGKIGVAEPQVDDVLAGPASLDLEVVNDGEHVGGQRRDAPELHGGSVLLVGSGQLEIPAAGWVGRSTVQVVCVPASTLNLRSSIAVWTTLASRRLFTKPGNLTSRSTSRS